ncbi:hypothetical protein BGZ54_005751 [Gamsiella multidivaricata]|nr:hypothetical protein BGZ54_005751 [Gamsiella multidivaricata]
MNASAHIKYRSNPAAVRTRDTDMDGVEAEVSLLSVQDNQDEVMAGADDDEDDESAVPGLCEDSGSDPENDDSEDEGHRHQDQDMSEEVLNDEETSQTGAGEQLYQSSSAASSTSSLGAEPSIISIPEATYSAVPISSEVHIIPHSSKGFKWNEDLFLRPNQRRNLGVDDLYNSDSSSGGSSSGSGNHNSSVGVHEIRLDDDESRQILPS